MSDDDSELFFLQRGEGSVQALYNGFGAGSLHGTNNQSPNQPQHFHHPQAYFFSLLHFPQRITKTLNGLMIHIQLFTSILFIVQGGNTQTHSFGATAGTVMNQSQASGSTTGGTPAQPKQRVRARRGQATDPHSIAERVSNPFLLIST